MSSADLRRKRQQDILDVVSGSLPEGAEVSALGDFGEEILLHIGFPDPNLTDSDEQRISALLERSGYHVVWVRKQNSSFLRIRTPLKKSIPWTNIVMFALTCVSVFFVPQCTQYQMQAALSGNQSVLNPLDWLMTPSAWLVEWGASFTFWLLFILLAHEFGHYFAGRRRNLRLSLPYFIPFPSIIGTMGAVIRFRSAIENRRDLLEIGAAGPIAGFIVAVIAIAIGLSQTDVTVPGAFYMRGESILMTLMGQIFLPGGVTDVAFDLHPAAFAGWVGLLVTAMNLLPLGQLDGGHIIYGMFGKRQRSVAWVALVGLFIAGLYWPVWWFYGFLALMFGPFHGQTMHDEAPLTASARSMGYISIVIFILSISLAPFGP